MAPYLLCSCTATADDSGTAKTLPEITLLASREYNSKVVQIAEKEKQCFVKMLAKKWPAGCVLAPMS